VSAAPAPRPYLQVHPSRRCNLRCRHCYTASGPGERGALDVATLAGAMRDAAGLGYAEIVFRFEELTRLTARPALAPVG
jgi:MoaA/NifB/PqqE/SkfB family radical SAM enzyme